VPTPELDTDQLDQILGVKGKANSGVYQFALPRREAIREGGLTLVPAGEVNDFALKHGITLVQGDLIGARWVANQIAIERALEKTGAKHVITFHSRVSSARDFSSDGSWGIKQHLPDLSVFHVNGSQHTSERKQLFATFVKPRNHSSPMLVA
jgi:hypothetical protein